MVTVGGRGEFNGRGKVGTRGSNSGYYEVGNIGARTSGKIAVESRGLGWGNIGYENGNMVARTVATSGFIERG